MVIEVTMDEAIAMLHAKAEEPQEERSPGEQLIDLALAGYREDLGNPRGGMLL